MRIPGRPAEAGEGIDGAIVEPGHHYEWIWLLRRFERETGRPVARFVDALYGHATEHGFDAEGLIVDELLADGSCRSPSRRLWPITEAIKANVVEGRLGRPGAEEGRQRSPNGWLRACCSRRPGAAGSTGSTKMATGRSTICRPAPSITSSAHLTNWTPARRHRSLAIRLCLPEGFVVNGQPGLLTDERCVGARAPNRAHGPCRSLLRDSR